MNQSSSSPRIHVPPTPEDDDPLRGLECRNCGCRHFHVVYTRPHANCIVRRRECRYCGRRITTRERCGG
ncbi:MAG: hypothetical protein ACE15C_14785 [Phycisphaerae bacterium]